MNYDCMMWLFLTVIFLLLELGHPGLFFFLSFSIGSFLALLATLLEVSFFYQLLTMLGGTLFAVGVLHYFLRKTKQLNRAHEPKTNMFALQGKTGVALTDITEHSLGRIKVGSEEWSARTHAAYLIHAGSYIEVVTVRGCHCIVKQIT